MMPDNSNINKDLILREKLALQRTVLANQTTFLSFLRTSMYFLMAGITIRNIFKVQQYSGLEILFYLISISVFVVGIFNYFRHKRLIELSKVNIGDYKDEYLNK